MKRNTSLIIIFAAALGIPIFGCESNQSKKAPVTQNNDSDSNEDTETRNTDPVGNVDTENVDVPAPPAVPVCKKTCQDRNDCVEFGASATEQAENYSCNGGICFHLGCTDDANCKAAHPGQNYKCSPQGECLAACTAPEDCVRLDIFAGDDDMDANNFKCEEGMCRYLGCLSTAECGVSRGVSSLCIDINHTGVPQCKTKCSEGGEVDMCVEDHDDVALDSDNYDCVLQACFYTGCNNDEECGEGRKCVKVVK